MDPLEKNLLIAQVVCLMAATVLVLIQNRGAGLSSSFGGKDDIYITKRGIEKTVVRATVVFIAAFVIIKLIALYV